MPLPQSPFSLVQQTLGSRAYKTNEILSDCAKKVKYLSTDLKVTTIDTIDEALTYSMKIIHHHLRMFVSAISDASFMIACSRWSAFPTTFGTLLRSSSGIFTVSNIIVRQLWVDESRIYTSKYFREELSAVYADSRRSTSSRPHRVIVKCPLSIITTGYALQFSDIPLTINNEYRSDDPAQSLIDSSPPACRSTCHTSQHAAPHL